MAGGVDQYQFFIGELRQQPREHRRVRRGVNRDAEQAGVHGKLGPGADAPGIRRNQRNAAGTMHIDPTRGELGERRGLAHTGRTDQRQHAAQCDRIRVARQHRQIAKQHLAQPALRGVGVQPAWQACGERARQCATEARGEQRLHQRHPHRIAPPRTAPGEAGELVLQQTTQTIQLMENSRTARQFGSIGRSGCRQLAIRAGEQLHALRVRSGGQHHGIFAKFVPHPRQPLARIRRDKHPYAHDVPPIVSSVVTCTILSAGTSA